MQILSKLRTAVSLLAFSGVIVLAAPRASEATANNTDAPALRSIAFEHYLSGDSDAALDYYQKAIDTAVKDYGKDSSYIAQLYYEMGTLALDAKKFIRSEAYLQKAVQHNPNSIMSRVKYAECLEVRGKNDEALVQIQAALAKHSNSPEAREALVSWLQANHRAASAIHESYNLSVAANGRPVPLPVPTVLAKATDPTLVAAAPPPVVAPAAIAPNSPLKLFPWMDKKSDKDKEKEKADEKKAAEKKAADKAAEEKKVEAKKQEVKKEKKAEKKSNKADKQKESKASKQAKDKVNKHQNKAPKQQVQVAQEEIPALRTTAKTIKVKKESSEGGDEISAKPKNDVTPRLSMPNMAVGMPTMPIKSTNRSHTMVPPPPPLVPSFGGMPMFGGPPPSQSVYAKPPVAKVAKKKTPPPAAATAPKEAAESPPPKAAASSSGGAEEDPNFLLDWAGTAAKKKK